MSDSKNSKRNGSIVQLGVIKHQPLQCWLLGFPMVALPFFLGGARPWYWSTIAGIFLSGLALLTLTGSIRWQFPTKGFRIWLLIVLVAFVFFQAIPLTDSLLLTFSPKRIQWLNRAFSATGFTSLPTLSYVPLTTLFEAIWLVFLVLYAIVLLNAIQHPRNLNLFFIILFGVATFEAFYGLLQVLIPSLGVLWESPGQGDARGTFVNRNHYACFLGMIWPLLLANLLAQRGQALTDRSRVSFLQVDKDRKARQKQMFLTLMVGLVLLSLVFSHSRGGLIGAVVALTVFVFFGGKKIGGMVFFVIFCWLIMLAYGSIIGFEQILARFDLMHEDAPGRLRIWEDTWHMIQDHPWFGVGFGAYETAIRLYQSHLTDQLQIGQAHNDYLQLAAELGIPVAASVSLFVWGYWWKSATEVRKAGTQRNGKAAKKGEPVIDTAENLNEKKELSVRATAAEGIDSFHMPPTLLRLGALAASASFLVHSWVEFNWEIPANQLYLVVLLTLMSYGRER